MRSQLNTSKLRIPAKLYRIGELVRYTPFSRQTIHNYTIMGLISEIEWTEGGHRLYDESVFQRLSRILQLRKTKTLFEIRQILRTEDAGSKTSSPQRKCEGTGEEFSHFSSSVESNKTKSDPNGS
jgi:DNA-binding transcriptional MerR regulator